MANRQADDTINFARAAKLLSKAKHTDEGYVIVLSTNELKCYMAFNKLFVAAKIAII